MKPISKYDVSDLGFRIAEMLAEKNAAYGNSVFNPVRVFSQVSPVDQIGVRIDDKLSRIFRGHEFPGDDTLMDLAGYLVILLVAMEHGEMKEPPDPAVFYASSADICGAFLPEMAELSQTQRLDLLREDFTLDREEICRRGAVVMTAILQQRREQSEGLKLDPRPARALTSRECCKMLCGSLSSINSHNRLLDVAGMKAMMRSIMALTLSKRGPHFDQDLGLLEQVSSSDRKLLGHIGSVSALVASMLECSGPEPVEQAIRWLLETEHGDTALSVLCDPVAARAFDPN